MLQNRSSKNWVTQNFVIVKAYRVEIYARNTDKPMYDSFKLTVK